MTSSAGMTRLLRRLPLVCLLLLLGACGGHMYHVVERGETLYSIGWIYGYEHRDIARWNRIAPPYNLTPGQRLRVTPPSGEAGTVLGDGPALVVDRTNSGPHPGTATKGAATTGAALAEARREPAVATFPVTRPGVTPPVVTRSAPPVKGAPDTDNVGSGPINQWYWPSDSRRLVSTYAPADPARQGVAIAGETDSPVYAAATGRVVYAGSGLPRYGRLIILKHNEDFLSAYAHNNKLLVKEGDEVKGGQHIAGMGNSGTNRIKLHFEIRRNGKPVDPLQFLPQQ